MSFSFSYNPASPSLDNPASYQLSGIPWVTSSAAPATGEEPLEVSFYNVTDFVVVKNTSETDNSLKVGFSENGLQNGNYFILAKDESFAADIRITDLYLISNTTSSVDFTVITGLTSIERTKLENNWSGSAGVG
jgi:hypothetical protein